jgi:hypothetical protein
VNSNICFTFGVLERTNDQNKHQMKANNISKPNQSILAFMKKQIERSTTKEELNENIEILNAWKKVACIK